MPRTIAPLDVQLMFEELTQDLLNRGFTRYSARAILHVIRWHKHLEQGNRDFKCNNNWTPLLARNWLERHPEYPEFFELRDRRNGHWVDPEE
jgi:hypothetical protein